RLVALGVPISATYGSEAGFFSVVALVIASFGPAALAAYAVVNQLVYIVFQVTVGISHGASILVSRETAKSDPAAAAKIARTALILGAVVMTVIGLGYVLAPSLVLRPFLTAADHTAFGIATTLLLVAAVLQFFDCAQNIGVGLPVAWLIGYAAGAALPGPGSASWPVSRPQRC
ncbi:MAG: MATE family efflux transporter, partial [Sciscionella sp.]